jgi:hypothetical protein
MKKGKVIFASDAKIGETYLSPGGTKVEVLSKNDKSVSVMYDHEHYGAQKIELPPAHILIEKK